MNRAQLLCACVALQGCAYITDAEHAARLGQDTAKADGGGEGGGDGTSDGADGTGDGADGASDGGDGASDGADGAGDGADGSGDGADGTDGADGGEVTFEGVYKGTMTLNVGSSDCMAPVELTIAGTRVTGAFSCFIGLETADGTFSAGLIAGTDISGAVDIDHTIDMSDTWTGFIREVEPLELHGSFEGSTGGIPSVDYDGTWTATIQ